MSAGESKQTYTVEDIKTELRLAVRQLSELTRSDATFDQFCDQVLTKLVKLTGSHGALLWQSTSPGNAQISHKLIVSELNLSISDEKHRQAVNQVIQDRAPAAVDSKSLVDGEVEADGTHCLMLFAPVFNRKRESCGTLELLQRGSVSDSAREGYLKFLVRIAELFQRWHEHHDLERLSHSADQLSTTMEFVEEVHKSIDFKETAFTIANESRRLLNCDRVSFAKWNGSSCKVIAVSSQDRFDNRANVIRKLGNLATSSVSANVPLWLTGDTEGLAPEIVKNINEYMDESHCRTLAVIPLLKPEEEDTNLEFKPQERRRPKKLGALIIEFFDEDVAQNKILDSVQLITNHSQLASSNAIEHDQIFLRPLWKRLGDLSWFLFHDHFAKTMSALGALLLFTLYLIIVPSELKMRVAGVIQPAERKNIFAQTDGVATEISVDQGDFVTAGDTLMVLENVDLAMSIEDTQGQLAVVNQQLSATIGQISNNTDLTETELNSLWAQKEQLNKQKANLENRIGLLNEKERMLTIASPIDGKVVTWDAKNRLQDLPISKNQHVLAVADFNGDWQAELRVPQNQVGYVVAAMNDNKNEQLDVEFRVATNPNILFKGKLIRLADRTDPGEAGVPEFKAIVAADVSELKKDLRPGAGLTAKIHCGRFPTGKVWFYQVIDFLRTRVFF